MPDANANAIELGKVSQRVSALEKDIAADHMNNSEAHGELYTRVGKLESGKATTDAKFELFEKTQDEIRADVKSLLSQDGNKWRSTTNEIVKWATLLVLGYVAMKLGITV